MATIAEGQALHAVPIIAKELSRIAKELRELNAILRLVHDISTEEEFVSK